MAFIISPNMNLVIPGVGTEAGPTYALDVNTSLTSIDQHDHSPGKGVQITPAGININTNLSFNNHFLTQAAGITLLSQSTTPALNTVYELANDLYFVDGLGNNIRITNAGGVAGTPGSISNLTPPASANYVAFSSTFVWQSDVNVAANMDFGAAIMRNLSPNSTFALTLQPPALSSNYTLTLPYLPAAQSIMTLDNAGNITAPWTVDNSTIKIVANKLVAQSSAVSPNREHNWELNGPYPLLSYPLINIDAIFLAPANIVITSVWIYNGTPGTSGTTEYDLLYILGPGLPGTSILSTTGKIASTAISGVWTDSGSIIGPLTGVTKPVLGITAIPAGSAIIFTLLTSQAGTATDARIRIYYSLA